MSVSQIKEGSRFINEKLKDKAYFATSDSVQKLLFNSVDLKILKEDDDVQETITPTMLENDKHIINVIYELLDNVEKSKSVRESTLSQHQQQINEINKLTKQNEYLNNKLNSQLGKFYEKDMEILRLNQALKISNHDKHLIKKERNQLKMINESLKEKQKIEIKKKNIEIDELRDKFIIKLNNNVSITSKSIIIPAQQQQQQQQQQSLGPPSRPLITELIDKQTQTLLENSSNLIYELILNNEINSKFLSKLNTYFENLNNKLSIENTTLLNKFLPNFKEFVISELQENDQIEISDDLNVAINNASNFNNYKKTFIENLSKFDQLISEKIDANTTDDDNNNIDSNLVANLKIEIENLKLNWNKLNDNAEKWKSLYKESTLS